MDVSLDEQDRIRLNPPEIAGRRYDERHLAGHYVRWHMTLLFYVSNSDMIRPLMKRNETILIKEWKGS